MLYNLIGHTLIQPESRVAQFIMASSDSFGKYMGGYNTDEGQLPEQMGWKKLYMIDILELLIKVLREKDGYLKN